MAEENKAEQSVEMISFGIIANAGDARSFAFQALEAAKKGKFDEADELMKKMEKYWEERGEENSINAVGLSEYLDVYKDYDIIMTGPQVSYRLNQIKQDTGLPTEGIPSFDYAVGNCANIMKIANKLYAQK